MSDDSQDNVIYLVQKPGLSIKRSSILEDCQHRRIEIDDDFCVTCRTCKKQLNPGKILYDMAKKTRKYQWDLESLKSRCRDLEDNVEKLKKEETRIKSSIRYQKKKRSRKSE